MMVVHQGDYLELTLVNPETNEMAAQYRLPLCDRRAWRRGTDACEPRRTGVLRWKATRTGVFVYHCAPGGDDPLARRLGHERRGDGPAPRGTEEREGKPLRYDKAFYIGETGLLCAARRGGQVQDTSTAPARPIPTRWR